MLSMMNEYSFFMNRELIDEAIRKKLFPLRTNNNCTNFLGKNCLKHTNKMWTFLRALECVVELFGARFHYTPPQ